MSIKYLYNAVPLNEFTEFTTVRYWGFQVLQHTVRIKEMFSFLRLIFYLCDSYLITHMYAKHEIEV